VKGYGFLVLPFMFAGLLVFELPDTALEMVLAAFPRVLDTVFAAFPIIVLLAIEFPRLAFAFPLALLPLLALFAASPQAIPRAPSASTDARVMSFFI